MSRDKLQPINLQVQMTDMEDRFAQWQPPEIIDGVPTKYHWLVQNCENFTLGYKTDIKTFTYINWPNLRWKIVDFERYRYVADKVEIRFHLFDKYFTNSFPEFHAEVYDFDFWIE